MASSKKMKKSKTAQNPSLRKNIKMIRNTASSVNEQIMETASEVAKDVRIKGEQLRDDAVVRAKAAIENIDVQAGMKKIKQTAADVNNFTLEATEELIEGALKNGEQWQGIANKAVNGGLKLAAKQQDMMFNTLETLKSQMIKGGERLRKLLK